MARARFIRPEFFTDSKIGDLCHSARLLFEATWCHADLRGVFEYNAKELRVLAFPYDEGITAGKIDEWLDSIKGLGLIGRFEATGKTWGAVTNWAKHQPVNAREVEIGSTRPIPPGWVDPPEWSAIIDKAIKAGRIKSRSNHHRVVTEPPQNNTLTLSPSQTQALSLTPSPSQEAPPPTPPLGSDRISIGKPEEIREALRLGYLPGILACFGVDPGLDIAKWFGASDGLQMASFAAILWWRWREGDRIRYVSGFSKARSEWKALKPAARKEIGELFFEHIGEPVPTP